MDVQEATLGSVEVDFDLASDIYYISGNICSVFNHSGDIDLFGKALNQVTGLHVSLFIWLSRTFGAFYSNQLHLFLMN